MRRSPAVLLTTCALVLAACGGGGKSTTTTTPNVPGTPAPKAVGPVAPLTGLPEPDEAARTRPVLTIKVDNSPEARPQFGIDLADDIVEEKVEGGISRFMAIFSSKESDQVGPVRSLRSTDPAWLKPEGGMIAYSGGIDPVKSLLAPAGITDLGADNHGATYYKRMSGRPFEHSLYTLTPVLRTLTPKDSKPPKPLYNYVAPGDPITGAGAAPVHNIQGAMGEGASGTRFSWDWNAEKGVYLRGTDGRAHNLTNGQLAMTNVVLQFTTYRQTPWRDRANSPVDEAVTTGNGDAWIFTGGQFIRAKWSRPSENDVTGYTDANGATIKLTPGRTWLSLVPAQLQSATQVS